MNLATNFIKRNVIKCITFALTAFVSILLISSLLFFSGSDLERQPLAALTIATLGLFLGVLVTVIVLWVWAKENRTHLIHVKNNLVSSEYEQKYNELKVALDAHAIVAVTNSKGIITQVNDKFCAISQYSHEELIGKTHRVISSGHHNPSFFKNFWQTITNGDVWSGDICNRAKDGSIYWVHSTIVPLIGKNGKPEQYISIRADITSRKAAEAKARSMALHDELTSLPNRYLMKERLVHAISSKYGRSGYAAVMMVDLDNFKEVNDTLGHALGDDLLRQVSSRLTNNVRKADTVSRFGGDEFVIVFDYVGTSYDCAKATTSKVCEAIREKLSAPYLLDGQQLVITPSMGVVLFNSEHDDPDELIKQADIALYSAKEAGRNQVSFFNPCMQEEAIEKALMTRDLRQALDKNQMALFYQPIVDAKQEVKGVEALIRWHHPKYGSILPTKFIPLAEISGLILPIGKWVLTTACEQLIEWQQDPIKRKWRVAVNVSAKQLNQVDFVETVINVITKTGAPANQLIIELTESVLQDNIESTVEKMNALQKVGVRFSLDDFGTGYSSLSYLKRLPIDNLKIDKSFVDDIFNDPSDADIARTIITLAKSLNVGVVAEGVETQEQFDWLLEHDCSYFQGYLFFQPMAIDQLNTTVNCNANA